MDLKDKLEQLNKSLANVKNIAIFLPANPSYDMIAAGLSLYLGLLKQGKIVNINSSDQVKVSDSDLVGIDKVRNSLGGKNLVISFPYEEGEIDKVSYNFEENQFNLVIEPKNDLLKFSPESVKFKAAGFEADLILTIGIIQLADIGNLYHENQLIFEKIDIINFDNNRGNTNFGKINIVNSQLPTVSEIIVLVLKNLNIILDKDIATNLYKGLQRGTEGFHPTIVSALTLEAAALCLRSGAVRETAGIKPQPETRQVFTKSFTPPKEPIVSNSKIATPSDWLKPKIFTTDDKNN